MAVSVCVFHENPDYTHAILYSNYTAFIIILIHFFSYSGYMYMQFNIVCYIALNAADVRLLKLYFYNEHNNDKQNPYNIVV